jgi:hypothetical protein
MNPILRNILAVVAGLVLGSIANMLLISVGPMLIPPPEGGDVTSYEGLQRTIHLFEPEHFIFPFLAHALGTLVGAAVAARFAANRHLIMAIIIGVLFLIGGIINITTLAGPIWFNALDVVAAYLPMAWLGWRIAGTKSN